MVARNLRHTLPPSHMKEVDDTYGQAWKSPQTNRESVALRYYKFTVTTLSLSV